MSTYVPERGYWLGPTLEPGENPFAPHWEQMPGLDDCGHEWERVVVRYRHQHADEPCVRCRLCHCPRCGHSDDRDPCMERRHHRTVHIRLHGEFEPVGGYLLEETS